MSSKCNKSPEDEKRAEVYRAEFVVNYYVDRREPRRDLKAGEGGGVCDMTKFVSGQYRGWFTRGWESSIEKTGVINQKKCIATDPG